MYRDPQESKSTPYLAVTGEKAAFRPRNPRLWRSLTPKCAMVVTVRNSDVFWSEPRDISAPEAEKGDRLRWVGSVTIYLNGSLNHDEWRKGDTGQFCTPEFELPADADN